MTLIAISDNWPKRVQLLTLFLCAYLAAPLYDVPFSKLSWSAPIMLFLFFDVMKNGGLQPKRFQGLVWYVTIFLFTIAFSLGWNQVFGSGLGDYNIGIKTLINYSYWFVCCLVVCRLFSFSALPSCAAQVIASTVVVMAGFISVEFLIWGELGRNGLSRLNLMTQNSYAWQFSTFLPFVYAAFMEARGRTRLFWGVGVLLCMAAVVMLSSRSGWGTALLGLVLFGSLYAMVTKRFVLVLTTVFLIMGMAASISFIIPESTKANILFDYNSLQNLEQDKSWMERQFLIAKGLELFNDNLVFGVGPGQFKSSRVDIELPDVFGVRSSEPFMNRSAHNSYIMVLSEGGLSFVLPFGAFLLWLLFSGLRSALFIAHSEGYWGLALWCGFVGMSIHFWTLSGLTGTAPWFVYGLVTAMIYRARRIRMVLAV